MRGATRKGPKSSPPSRTRRPSPARTRTRPTTARAAGRGETTARDLMARDVITVSPATPLSEVERLLSENRITGMPVVDSSGRPVGVISVQDLMDRYAEDPDARPRRGGTYFRMSMEELLDERFENASPPSASEEKAGDLMTPEIVDVAPDATVREIARTMARRQVHRVLVTEPRTGRMIGIIGSLAVLEAVGR